MEGQKIIHVLDFNSDVYSIIKKITEIPNQECPFYICDLSRLIWLCKNWEMLMPRVQIFYAIKCNNFKSLLETFAAMGTGFDCASKEEIRKVISLGVPPNKIIFANPTKLISDIEYAAEVGVNVMTFDNEAELYKVKKYHPKAELVIRIRSDDATAKRKLGEKFGILPETEAWGLLKVAKSLDLNVIGVAFHVGSGCGDYSMYYHAIAASKKVFDMGSKLDYQFKLLDIGGGYPGESYKPLDKIAEYVNKGLDEYFPGDSIKVIAEPGKYACNTVFKLVSQINSKNIIDISNQKVRMYYVDVSVFNSLFFTLFNEYYDCTPVNKTDKNQVYPSIIWGPTQDTLDRMSETYHYLPDLQIDDWIIFEETGGYSLSITSGYNGFSIPDVCTIINKEDWLMLNEGVSKPMPTDRFAIHQSTESFVQKLFLKSHTFTKYF